MINGLVGKKLGMTGRYDNAGNRIPVTALELGPVSVIQKKTIETDAYNAVQVGYLPVVSKGKLEKFSNPLKGHFKSNAPCKYLREFKPLSDIGGIEIGQTFDVSIFEKGAFVDVVGTSKGRGFSGVIKRHGFGGGPASHGHRFHRSTGSIGNCATPSRVFKNKKMPGQYGNKRITSRGLEIIDVNTEKNVIFVKGSVPGPTGRIVEVRNTKKAIKKAS